MPPSISLTVWPYFQKILTYHGLEYSPTCATPDRWNGHHQKIKGFDEYNYLLDINLCFSSRPAGDVRDRTLQTRMPYHMYVERTWTHPTTNLDLDSCFKSRIDELCQGSHKINLFWSGGIDSTSMVVGFLKHCKDLSRVRIMYSVTSRKENPGFFLLLEQHPDLEMLEMGGDVYMEQTVDGIFVDGAAGDDITASLDQSFFERLGWHRLNQPWQTFFYEKTQNSEFVNYCEEFFARSQRPIQTLLQARWWFYMCCKNRGGAQLTALMQESGGAKTSFFYCQQFDDYMWHNVDQLLPNKKFSSYKQFFKDYIFEFDKNYNYHQTKTKVNSGQASLYRLKKEILTNNHWIMLLSDGNNIAVDHLPFLSEQSYRNKYGNGLDYLFQ